LQESIDALTAAAEDMQDQHEELSTQLRAAVEEVIVLLTA
jgi:hypothetical protein